MGVTVVNRIPMLWEAVDRAKEYDKNRTAANPNYPSLQKADAAFGATFGARSSLNGTNSELHGLKGGGLRSPSTPEGKAYKEAKGAVKAAEAAAKEARKAAKEARNLASKAGSDPKKVARALAKAETKAKIASAQAAYAAAKANEAKVKADKRSSAADRAEAEARSAQALANVKYAQAKDKQREAAEKAEDAATGAPSKAKDDAKKAAEKARDDAEKDATEAGETSETATSEAYRQRHPPRTWFGNNEANHAERACHELRQAFRRLQEYRDEAASVGETEELIKRLDALLASEKYVMLLCDQIAKMTGDQLKFLHGFLRFFRLLLQLVGDLISMAVAGNLDNQEKVIEAFRKLAKQLLPPEFSDEVDAAADLMLKGVDLQEWLLESVIGAVLGIVRKIVSKIVHLSDPAIEALRQLGLHEEAKVLKELQETLIEVVDFILPVGALLAALRRLKGLRLPGGAKAASTGATPPPLPEPPRAPPPPKPPKLPEGTADPPPIPPRRNRPPNETPKRPDGAGADGVPPKQPSSDGSGAPDSQPKGPGDSVESKRSAYGADDTRTGPIGRSVGALSRLEKVARRHGLNPDSPTTRQVLHSLDDTVESFVARFRRGGINRELPGEVRKMTVEQALDHSSKVRKLLIDGRFAK